MVYEAAMRAIARELQTRRGSLQEVVFISAQKDFLLKFAKRPLRSSDIDEADMTGVGTFQWRGDSRRESRGAGGDVHLPTVQRIDYIDVDRRWGKSRWYAVDVAGASDERDSHGLSSCESTSLSDSLEEDDLYWFAMIHEKIRYTLHFAEHLISDSLLAFTASLNTQEVRNGFHH